MPVEGSCDVDNANTIYFCLSRGHGVTGYGQVRLFWNSELFGKYILFISTAKKSIFEGKVYPANPNFVFHIKSTMAWRMSPSTSFGSSFKLTVILTHTGLAVDTLTGSNLQGWPW